ncbi:MAG: hypothetical protein AAFQ82_19065, partial [Myxococcota bacterium]
SGDSGGSSVGVNETSVAQTVVPGTVGIIEVSALEDNCAIEVTWVTDEDDGSPEYVVLRREFGSGASFAEVGRVPSLAPAVSGFVYGFRDVDAAQGIAYQYLIRAVNPVDDSELSVGGPTVASPGLPFTDVPASTGDIEADYASSGVVVEDLLVDIPDGNGQNLDGYDVDRIALAYDQFNDSLYLAVSAVGIFGDGDGDGDPDTSTLGSDQPNFSVDEGFAFVLDFDSDGTGDAVVGVPFGTDLDYLQATEANPSLVGSAPTLAFSELTVEQAGSLFVELLNTPSASAPDLELVVRNISVLNNDAPLDDLDFNFYLAASDATSEVEWAPSQALTTVSAQDSVTAGCGIPAQQIRLGVFATFGNIFTGTPRFDFVPFGWVNNFDMEVLATPPDPVPGQVITSPTIFLGEKNVRLSGVLSSNGLNLSQQDVQVRDEGNVSGNDYLHFSEIEWSFSESEGDERYENIDLQVFRLFVLECSATVIIEQAGISGVLRDDRLIRLADDSTTTLGAVNPALTLAHSGLGTFETGGAIQRIHFGEPEDWVSDLGPTTAPEFTQYSFLDDVSYLGNTVTPEQSEVYPLGVNGVQVEAGIWFLNHYLWTYANEGFSRIETRFIPGPDCGGSL